MLIWLKKVLHYCHRKMQGTREDAVPCLPPKKRMWNWNNGKPFSLPASNVHRRWYLLMYIIIYTDITQGQTCRHVTSLLDFGDFPKESNISTPFLPDWPSLFRHQSVSETIVLKAGWRKRQVNLQQQEQKVYIPQYCKWQVSASKVLKQPCIRSQLSPRETWWQRHLVLRA